MVAVVLGDVVVAVMVLDVTVGLLVVGVVLGAGAARVVVVDLWLRCFLNRCRLRSLNSCSCASRCCPGGVGFGVVVGVGGLGARGGVGVVGLTVSVSIVIGGCICIPLFTNLPLRIRLSRSICSARF